jgi:hypothetical protein
MIIVQHMTKPSYYRKVYMAYRDQNRRCYDISCKEFPWYGAKGIRVEYSFDDFLSWWIQEKDLNPHLEKYSVGRKDHTKNYSLDNIELVSKSQNSKERINRKGTPIPRRKVSVFKGKKFIRTFESAKAAAETLGLHQSNIIEILNGNTYRKSHLGYTFKEPH